jgi:hypothetical protein
MAIGGLAWQATPVAVPFGADSERPGASSKIAML